MSLHELESQKLPLWWKLYLIATYVICCAGVSFFVVAAVFAYLILFPLKKIRNNCISKMIHLFLNSLFLKLFPLMRLYKLSVIFENPERKLSQAIYISNHTSWLDPLLMLAMFPKCGIILKDKYAHGPIALLTKIFYFIKTTQTPTSKDIDEVVAKSSEALAQKFSLIVFPEGRRSTNGRLLDFKKSAFKIAKDNSLPIVPVVINFSKPIFYKGQFSVFQSKDAEIDICVLDEINSEKIGSLTALSDCAYDRILKKLSQIKNKIVDIKK